MLRNNGNAVSRVLRRGFKRFGWPLLALLTILVAAGLLAQSACATPVSCAPGYQDNTCLTPIHHDPTPAPKCSTDPGWITNSDAVWQGSHWSQPQCSYQPPPSCPAGMQQTAAPIWTGSRWTQPGCQFSPPQPVPISDQQQACVHAAAAYGKFVSPASAFGSRLSEATSQVVNDINKQPPPRICEAPGSSFGSSPYGDLPPTNGPFDVYKIGFGTYVMPDIGSGDAGYVYGASSQVMACMLNPGTTQV